MARALDKSDRQPPLGCFEATEHAPWADGALCDLTFYLAPGAGAEAVVEAATELTQRRLAGEAVDFLSRDEVDALVRPGQGAAEAVVAALKASGIQHVHPVGLRGVHVQGRWAELAGLLEVRRMRFRTPEGVLVGRAGPINVTDAALDSVVALFGLDNRRAVSSYVIKSHVIKSHVIKSHVIKSHGDLGAEMEQALDDPDREWFTPGEIADWYDFPNGSGAGARIAVLAFSGTLGGTDQVVMGGYHEQPLRDFWEKELRLPTSPTLRSEVVRGPGNWPSDGEDDPSGTTDFTDEVMLDLSVVGALAPRSDITVWFTEPTEQGFVDALHAVVEQEDPPDVLLICYGAPEDKGTGTSWTPMAIEQSDLALAMAALRGITVVVSCGDNGAAGMPLSTRVHADYPASSPWVLGVGGTTVRPDHAGTDREIVWNDGLGASGGGVSSITRRPSWQPDGSVPEPVDAWTEPEGFEGRGVPDVSAVADLTTGVAVVDAAGNTVMGGGTSVSAPVWAGLLARCREQAGGRLGFVTPLLYRHGTGVRDVPKGDNGAYAAKAGAWDPCTGLGVPDGRTIGDALS